MSTRNTTQRIALSAMLLSLMLILGYVENQIPIAPGTPGIKLGLSNGVLILSLYLLGFPYSIGLMVGKVLLSGLLFAGVMAMPYALAGGLLSVVGMGILKQMKGVHPVIVSIFGGLLHNVGQVGMAMIILGTPALISYMAVLMPVGMATGAATGIASTGVLKRVRTLVK